MPDSIFRGLFDSQTAAIISVGDFLLCMGISLILGLIMSTDFTRYFTIFHQIFFDNDLWILNPATDLLINIVPEPFFMDTALYIGLVFGIFLLIVLVVSTVYCRKYRRCHI